MSQTDTSMSQTEGESWQVSFPSVWLCVVSELVHLFYSLFSDESDSSGGTPSPDQVTTDDELNVKDIEQEVAQEDAAAAAAAVRSVARSEKAEGKESVPPYANQLWVFVSVCMGGDNYCVQC